MRYFRLAIMITGFISILTACQKETLDNSDCDNLRNGMLMNDTKLVIERHWKLVNFLL